MPPARPTGVVAGAAWPRLLQSMFVAAAACSAAAVPAAARAGRSGGQPLTEGWRGLARPARLRWRPAAACAAAATAASPPCATASAECPAALLAAPAVPAVPTAPAGEMQRRQRPQRTAARAATALRRRPQHVGLAAAHRPCSRGQLHLSVGRPPCRALGQPVAPPIPQLCRPPPIGLPVHANKPAALPP